MREELVRGNATDIVARAIGRVPRIASVCSGTFFLAAAGALDGRRAATHWSEVEALKLFRPAVLVDGDAIHIEDRGVWTSAGVTAGMDLALAMVEADLGRKVALAIARRHVLFRIRPGGQSQFSAELVAQSTDNPKIKKLAEKVTAQPRADWRTDILAAEAGVSRRSLSRLFRMGLDVSPADFVERVRTDLARRRLAHGRAGEQGRRLAALAQPPVPQGAQCQPIGVRGARPHRSGETRAARDRRPGRKGRNPLRIWIAAPHGSRICPLDVGVANRVSLTLQDERSQACRFLTSALSFSRN